MHRSRCIPCTTQATARCTTEIDARCALLQVTGVTRDEMETLKLAARGFPLMRAVKSLPVRETQEHDSVKVGDSAAPHESQRAFSTPCTPLKPLHCVCGLGRWARSPRRRPCA